jgi:hypothetical protein
VVHPVAPVEIARGFCARFVRTATGAVFPGSWSQATADRPWEIADDVTRSRTQAPSVFR